MIRVKTDELRHFGVKGMKWGVRRTPAQLGHTTADAGGGGGGGVEDEELAKEMAELNQQLAQGNVQWEALSAETQNKYREYFSKVDKANSAKTSADLGTALNTAKDRAIDYVAHIPSDGLIQGSRKDKTGFLNTEEERKDYQAHQVAQRLMKKREQERSEAIRTAQENYEKSPGAMYTRKAEYNTGFLGIGGEKLKGVDVYKNDENGKPKKVGGRYRKQNGDVVYDHKFFEQANASKTDRDIAEAERRVKAVRSTTARKYAKGMGHSELGEMCVGLALAHFDKPANPTHDQGPQAKAKQRMIRGMLLKPNEVDESISALGHRWSSYVVDALSSDG